MKRLIGNVATKYSPAFERFWAAYPGYRKADKGQCFAKWKRHGLEEQAAAIMQLLCSFAESDQWEQEQFIPSPLRWLNSTPWDGGAIPPATKKREAEHRARLAEEARQARDNPLAKSIARSCGVDESDETKRAVAWYRLPTAEKQAIINHLRTELGNRDLTWHAARTFWWNKLKQASNGSPPDNK